MKTNSHRLSNGFHVRLQHAQAMRLEKEAQKLGINRSVLARKLLSLLDDRTFMKKHYETLIEA